MGNNRGRKKNVLPYLKVCQKGQTSHIFSGTGSDSIKSILCMLSLLNVHSKLLFISSVCILGTQYFRDTVYEFINNLQCEVFSDVLVIFLETLCDDYLL